MHHLDGILSPGSGTNISLRMTHTGIKKGDKHHNLPPQPAQESFEEINERGWVVRGVKPINSRSQSPQNRGVSPQVRNYVTGLSP
jgi:hypothetical protein